MVKAKPSDKHWICAEEQKIPYFESKVLKAVA